ncbi:hypothetical protein [Rhodococcus sp. 2G]|uniref:hypothetical protein n=1 Tax=Rhodococcus sp. 2G TaxID=1570939 RepID=UPI0012EB2C0C|nr:hypothetical protein [Rhodococcus sp. 2G]
MTYWLYKCNAGEGGPSGYAGDWLRGVFSRGGPVDWGGDYSTQSQEVSKYLAKEVAAGDVVVAYQTDTKSVVGFCTIARLTGDPGDRTLFLQPIHWLTPAFLVHEHKAGTPLEHSIAVNGPAAFRKLPTAEMKALVTLSGAPGRVLQGKPARDGWQPIAVRDPAELIVPLEDVWAESGRGYHGLEESVRLNGVLIKPKTVTFFASLDDLSDYVRSQVGTWEAAGYFNTTGEWFDGSFAHLTEGVASGMTVTYEPFTYFDAFTRDGESSDT